MKNIFFSTMVIVQMATMVHADWKLNVIYNESDLQHDGAFRLKNGKRKSTFVDKKIKNAVNKSVTMIDYKVVTDAGQQGYLCISLHDSKNEPYELCFDSQTSHAIEWQRSKTKKLVTTMPVMHSKDDTMQNARVFLKHNGHNIANARYEYDGDQPDVEIDLIIRLKDGVYSLELGEPVR